MNPIKKIQKFFFPKISEISPILKKIFQLAKFQDRPYLIFFGDSVSERISKYDSDKRTIDQMLNENLKDNYIVIDFVNSAYNLDIFHSFIILINRMKNRPKIIILPINMRSFSPQWHLNPEWQFSEEIKILNKFLSDPNSIEFRWKLPSRKPNLKKYYQTEVDYPLSDYKTIKQFIDCENLKSTTQESYQFRKRQIFIFHYLYNLNIDHPKLKKLLQILEVCSKNNIKLLIYITPVNYVAGIKFVGEDFLKYFNQNVKIVENIVNNYKNDKITIINCSTIFTPDYFFDTHLATEHLNQRGRREICNILLDNIVK